jgi:RNA polymerase sigma factor (sigma-70 family)
VPLEEEDLRDLIRKALGGDASSVRVLVDMLSPVIERAVAAVLWRRPAGGDVRQEARDMTQAVFLSLFEEDGKALRAWDPARGSHLVAFVGLLARRQVISLLRSRKTSSWSDEPIETERLDTLAVTALVPEDVIGSREHLRTLLDRIQMELSIEGLQLFQRLIIQEEPLAEVAACMNKSIDALYQWRSRLLRRLREISADILEDRVSDKGVDLRMKKRSSGP